MKKCENERKNWTAPQNNMEVTENLWDNREWQWKDIEAEWVKTDYKITFERRVNLWARQVWWGCECESYLVVCRRLITLNAQAVQSSGLSIQMTPRAARWCFPLPPHHFYQPVWHFNGSQALLLDAVALLLVVNYSFYAENKRGPYHSKLGLAPALRDPEQD